MEWRGRTILTKGKSRKQNPLPELTQTQDFSFSRTGRKIEGNRPDTASRILRYSNRVCCATQAQSEKGTCALPTIASESRGDAGRLKTELPSEPMVRNMEGRP